MEKLKNILLSLMLGLSCVSVWAQDDDADDEDNQQEELNLNQDTASNYLYHDADPFCEDPYDSDCYKTYPTYGYSYAAYPSYATYPYYGGFYKGFGHRHHHRDFHHRDRDFGFKKDHDRGDHNRMGGHHMMQQGGMQQDAGMQQQGGKAPQNQ